MAASPVLPNLKVMPLAKPAEQQPQRQSPVVRTSVHTMQTGVGARSARRRITPTAGFALEALGHAIEYLADEYVLASGSLPSIHAHDPQVEAMQLLMAANRSVYYACPVVPSLAERIKHSMLRWAH